MFEFNLGDIAAKLSISNIGTVHVRVTEAATEGVLLKKVFSKISKNSQENSVKVVPGPRDPGPRDPGTRDPPQSLKVGHGTPLKFKSGSPGPPSKFKSRTPGLPSKFKSGTPSPFFHEFFFFSEYLIVFHLCVFFK